MAGAVFWFALTRARQASSEARYFLLIACLFYLFDGTGYFFFSGITSFGDWAGVIAGLHPHWVWRVLLLVIGVASYYGVVLLAGLGFAIYMGVSMKNPRLLRLTLLPYVTAIAVIGISGLFNPVGIRLVWLSALPASAGAHSGMLWFRYYIPRSIQASDLTEPISRTCSWILTAVPVFLVFVFVLGRGINISR